MLVITEEPYTYSASSSNISFDGFSVVFWNNIADNAGGAIFSQKNSHVVFKGTSSLKFDDNNAGNHGGAIHSGIGSNVSFEGFSAVVFSKNIAGFDGSAVFVRDHSVVSFSDNSTMAFIDTKGTVVFSSNNSKVIHTGNSTVTFNNLTTRWCADTCLPYTGQGDVVAIDGDGLVWCSDRKLFTCLSEKCYCRKLEDLLVQESNVLVNITGTVTLSTYFLLQDLYNISIIGYNNLTVICVNGGGIAVRYCNSVVIEGVTWIGCGNYDITDHIAVVHLFYSNKVIIQKCTFRYSLGVAIFAYTTDDDLYIGECNFINNNHYTEHGAAIYYNTRPNYIITNIHIINCNFSYNGNARSIIYFGNFDAPQVPIEYVTDIYLNASKFHNNQGVSVYLSLAYTLHISGEVLFKDNVAESGAGIYITNRCKVTFDNCSNTKFINNSVFQNGAAIYIHFHSSVIFKQNSSVAFTNNKATNGTIYSEVSSNVTFTANCKVTFNGNTATQCGAAIYSADNSHVTFTGHSKTMFSNNVVSSENMSLLHNGTIYSKNNGCISFEEKSSTVFTNNIADFGAAIFSFCNSTITFKDRSVTLFINNIAQHCGILTSVLFSSITFVDHTKVTYNSNTLSCSSNNNQLPAAAIAMCTFQGSHVTFAGHSLVMYTNNTSGAIVFSESNVIIGEYSTVIFYNNTAQYSSGGAFTCYNSNVKIQDNSNVTFKSIKANQDGSTIYSHYMCKITFKDYSTSTFTNNTARNNGGAMFSTQPSDITFEGHSIVTFDHNTADNGGALYFTNSTLTFKGSSTVSFDNNEARQNGGVLYVNLNSRVIYEGMSRVRFDSNKARHGGALLANNHCNITITGNSVLLFINNEATESGGAGYFNSYCYLALDESANVTFDSNNAIHGAGIFLNSLTKFVVKGNSSSFFHNNLVSESGGGVKALNNSRILLNDHINIRFNRNTAQYGGAIFLDITTVLVNNTGSNKNLNFENNFARILGSSVYQDVTDNELCNSSCLDSRITGLSNHLIATPPNELRFYDPAECINDDDDTQCNNYYIQNIMLGTEISIPVCVLDYYNQPVNPTQFLVESEVHPNYSTFGPNQVLLSCDTFEGISITGLQSLSNSTNFSMNISLNTALYPDWKQILVKLIIELSPCHPGFWQYPYSTGCECYNANDIVFCSGSNSTIKRGYWFGTVTGKPTVTFCPINYCNFTCCETSNGYYHLSPVRDNQCRSHRSGTACSSCTDGYTLSFDSTECVNADSCTTDQTILVILLTVIYWIVMLILVFVLMYYKVGIGYLYSITYYYSIVDILLTQNLQASSGLYLTVSILSSFSKITPQFLGELCLTTGMSGIDQQFIHYAHPAAVMVILVVITLLARRSRRISAIISRGIIHVICLLLLLSYTSIASTSLLLMRSMTFHDIDKVYTYLSPDTEYFHGRHLAYGIVALLCTVTIVLGLPLLLTLEPLLNHKLSFIKIKPLLDQFQGCYKGKYRCFAGYYMICRLVIITIVIINSSHEFANYLLAIVCGFANLIHVTIKPYNIEILNILDGIILQFIIFAAALSLLDDFDSPSVITSAFMLVILPLLTFIAMTLFLHKHDVKNIITRFNFKENSTHSNNDANKNDVPLQEYDLIVDDSVRNNATICDVK